MEGALGHGTVTQEAPDQRRRGCLSVIFSGVLLLVLGAVGSFAAWTMYQGLLRPYETRIYPNVFALGVNLGGLTPDEASVHLAETIGDYDVGLLTLTDGERIWRVPWSDAGLRLNADATAQVAFSTGRTDPNLGTWLNILGIQEKHYEVAPVYLIDPEMARQALGQLASDVAVPPTNATLRLEGDELVAAPGQAGRALDVDATLANIIATVTYMGPDNQFVMTFQTVEPQLADTESAQAQAEELLNRQVQVSTYDWLSDETFTWTLGREEIIAWLRVEQAEDGSGPRVGVAEEAIQATLEGLAAELGKGRDMRLDGAVQRVLYAFESGDGIVELQLTHPTRTYVVQPGDDLTAIAAQVGVPPGLIAEVNPDVDLNWLQVGQELTIPSVDVLMPYPPVPGKKIVINIAEQRLRVYENGGLLYEWPISTGIANSPTYTGEFQVLDKNEEAYASQWDLWMPHFIAIYRAGGDTYNGIHALPILSSGRRLWEGALGSPASYGCIILGIQEAETLYNWAEIGVPVVIE
jgi:lipoprotein-anchoring transpeptidase ErfK/SrfK